MIRSLLAFLHDERGHTSIEYGLLIAVGAVAIVSSVVVMGEVVQSTFESLNQGWNGAPGAGN